MNNKLDNPLTRHQGDPDPPRVFSCDIWKCSKDICVGDRYVEKNNGRMCMDCAALYGDGGTLRIADPDTPLVMEDIK